MIDHIKFYGTATVGTKGQIVIPSDARDALDLQEGEKLIVVQGHNRGSLMILKTDVLQSMLGKLASLESAIGSLADQDTKHRLKRSKHDK